MLAISMASSSTQFAPAHKRPKLSLQTDSLTGSFVCHSQSFTPVLVSATAVTPTSSNTFNNTYDLTHRPSPLSTSNPSKSLLRPRSQSPRPSRKADRLYHLPYGVKSILKNSEVHNYSTVSPLTGSRKVLFPQPKKVSFAKDLGEEIVTKVYIARHSDLEWDSCETGVVESVESPGVAPATCNDLDNTDRTTTITQTIHKSRRDSGVCFSSTDIATLASNVPTESATFRSRKKRRWEWTLSPVRPHFEQKDTIPAGCSNSGQEIFSASRQHSTSVPQTERIEAADLVEIRPSKRRAASVDIGEENIEDTTDRNRAQPIPRRTAKRSNTL